MQAPNWTDFLQCSVCMNKYDATQTVPISLSCGHSLCKRCLTKLKTRTCPYDKTAVSPIMEVLPPNNALLQLLGEKVDDTNIDLSLLNLSEEDCEHFKVSRAAIEEVALFLQPLAEQGITAAVSHLTRPMLKKLVTVVNCQVLEAEGKARALRAARSIADRTITELLVMHQNQQQISTLLWTAVRNRGCQFLGPVMQEEALKLILKVLEIGKFLSRKTIVLYVVQQLQQDFPQASKTCVGHVVQLLYRASCFNVEKREDDSSLMQLKEEFRSYESLRREHDGQIIRMAMEAGLRISPEQWSTLLYGNHKHKSDMQSIIDKLIAQGAASSGLNELIVAIGRSQDPYGLSDKLIPHLEVLLKIDINIDKSSELVDSWESFAESMKALLATLQGFSTFMQIQSGRYKTGMCSNLNKVGGCPKGDKCTYAHSEEERERFRSLAKGNKSKSRTDLPNSKPLTAPVGRVTSGGSVRVGRMSGDLGPAKLDTSPYSSLGYDGYMGFVPGMQEPYEAFDPSLGYSSYSSGEIVIQPPLPMADHSSLPILQPHSAQTYSAGPQQLVGFPSTPHHHHHRHSGPITVTNDPLQVYTGKPLVPMEPYYHAATSRKNGSFDADLPKVYGGGPPSFTDASSHYNHPSGEATASNLPGYDPQSIMVSTSRSGLAGNLQSIRKMHESVKKSIEGSGRTQTPIMSPDSGHDSTSTSVGDSLLPQGSCGTFLANQGRVENARVTYPASSMAEEWMYAERAQIVSQPSSSSSTIPMSASGRSLPISSENLGYYPTTTAEYVSSGPRQPVEGSKPEFVAKGGGPLLSSHESASSSQLGYSYDEELCSHLSKMAVTSASSYSSTLAHQSQTVPGYPVSTSGLDSTYNHTMSDSHSVPISSPIPRPGSYTGSPVPDSYVNQSLSRVSEDQPLAEYSFTSSAISSVETTKTITTVSNTSSQSSRSTEEELRDRIKQLEQELKQKDATIEQQKRQQSLSTPKVHQHTSPIHSGVTYSKQGSISSPHHTGPIHHSSFSGPIQLHYSPHNTMQQYPSLYATGSIPSSSTSYYAQPTPTHPTYPHQWSGPLSNPPSGPPSGQLASGISPTPTLHHGTPPSSGLLVHPNATGGRIVPIMPNDSHPEDGMIAQYIQALEQQKAAHTQFAYPSDYYNVIPAPYAAVQHAPHAVRQYVFRPY